MRLRTSAALAATSALGAGAAAMAAGRYAAGAALRPARPKAGRAALPAGFERPALTVHSSGPDHVALTRSLAARLPGTYGLAGRGSHAVVGPVLEAESTDSGADTVVRRLERIQSGSLNPGDRVWLTPQLHTGNPRDALGLHCADVEVPGELGMLPAWFVPGERDTWVIAVHGLGATREQPLNVVPALARMRLPVLVLAYRGDPGAPSPSDGFGHLGDAEWRDLDAAIRYAVRHGARRVILHGWSTGASMALHAAANSALRDRVSGLVLDSPVLDWQVTLRALASARRTPRPLLPLAVRAAQGRTGLTTDRLSSVADPSLLRVPALLVHGPDDTIAPWSRSQDFAAARDDLVTLHTVGHAPHAAMWNASPRPYEEALRRFLVPLM
ncbi:alpha/beta hydrolase [Streptomyces daliensis]|uniref:Alpha/beta fold hydrolase n=1 Tax=Streptomyces daliensis TaxID=299421 RepID=A0A8T4IVS8_9ACTN|nr:alpha/beta fold hydrolase [Streptomyces daliensis]